MGHTLEELRARFSASRQKKETGEQTLSKVSLAERVQERRKKDSSKVYFEETIDGRDARLAFGKYSGRLLSELIHLDEGVSYLKWLSKKEFPPRLLELCNEWLSLAQKIEEEGRPS